MLKDGEIRTLKVDGEALEDEMECELEGETIQDAERVRSISIPEQSSKKEREKQETTYAQYKRSCVACVKRPNRDEESQEHTGAGSDEGRLHTFVTVCFP